VIFHATIMIIILCAQTILHHYLIINNSTNINKTNNYWIKWRPLLISMDIQILT